MERFVRLVVAGGIALVVGLWIVRLSSAGSPAWEGGAGLAALGGVALLAGIASEVEAGPLAE